MTPRPAQWPAIATTTPPPLALRIRAAGSETDDELVTGEDLAPNLVEALRATLG